MMKNKIDNSLMTGQELADKAKWIATDLTTMYAQGGIGQVGSENNKNYLINQYAYNKERASMIWSLPANGFFFDCVCLVKSILWGFNGDTNQIYGGAIYASHGVPDVGTEEMLKYCTEVSDDFNKIPIGAYLHMTGHAGIYIGNGLAVECTPAWTNNVQITAVGNIGTKEGYNIRTWENWGKLGWVSYTDPEPTKSWNKGDQVTLKQGSKIYGTDYKFKDWVYEAVLTVIENSKGDRAVIGIASDPVIGAVYCNDLIEFIDTEPEPIENIDSEGQEEKIEQESKNTFIVFIYKLIKWFKKIFSSDRYCVK